MPPPISSAQATSQRPLAGALPLVYVAAFAVSYYTNFVWFHFRQKFDASPAANLVLNAGFGLAYTLGCLTMARLARTLSPRRVLLVAYGLLIPLTLLTGLARDALAAGGALLAVGFVVAWTWPNLETLATLGKRGKKLGAAVAAYNIGWASMAPLTFAIAGWLYDLDPWTLFVAPSVGYLLAIAMTSSRAPVGPLAIPAPGTPATIPFEPLDPKQARDAALMLDLARWGNWGCYIVLSSLLPLLPFVVARLGFSTAAGAAFASIWPLARLAAFVLLGRWHAWHFNKPMFLLAMAAIPPSFGAIFFSNSAIVVGASQLVLGLAVGFVYTGSLFYSLHHQEDDSGAEAAMHEAVIGLGILLGPLFAAGAGLLGERYGFAPNRTTAVALAALMGALELWMLLRVARHDRRYLRARAAA